MKRKESPFQKIKQRFRQNKTAVAGLYLIIASFFIAVFAYLVIPDRTPLASRMNIALFNRPPGFTVDMLKVPKAFTEGTGIFRRIFLRPKR